ncbi:diguanylate cyclase [Treponema ruminis]|uniref:HD-GYP domain-containing protein n=1 Tax=Treponema ruminis TaxID=744515 RepID=A0A7W8G6C9_9SPIR|nr:diguanylate cyclase [Treponema ruminis]MBB5224678.1 hypothetical protein [Treponema ruminis]
MFNFIRLHQLNIMLVLCAFSTSMTIMLFITRFLPKKRKWIIIGMEIVATLLLYFDRFTYIYAGLPSNKGYIMMRLSNFIVFFMTSAIVFCFNFYLTDLLTNEGKMTVIPRRLRVTFFASAVGMLLAIIAAFTGLYYYFDAHNFYHRSPAFFICYIIPTICPIIQFSAIFKHRKSFSKFINTAIFLYTFFPVIVGLIQFFSYGISIVNMAIVLVSVSLYFFTYLDINDEVVRAHNVEIQIFKAERKNMKRIFSETAAAFAKLLEKNNKELQGHYERTAIMAKAIAKKAGCSQEDCEKAFYAAYVCDVAPEVLDCIKDFPFLSETAIYVGERYDGKGNRHPQKGDELPLYARIATVARDYETMINDATLSKFFVREEFIREAGFKYDPVYAKAAYQLLDLGTNNGVFDKMSQKTETEILCHDYRENITTGISVGEKVTEITFDCESIEKEKIFSAPSIILFDSSDGQVYETPKAIDAHKYLEYGELWFDSHIISTSAKNMEIRNVSEEAGGESSSYKVTASRFEDHLLIKMQSSKKTFEVIVALPSESKAAYIGITGENVHISNIKTLKKEQKLDKNAIPRLTEKVNYINRIESDIPNVQIVKPLSKFTRAIEIKERLKLYFHAQSLPDANLVWHCPYVLLYYSDDQKVYGKNYREFALIKLDGEENGSSDAATNTFIMRRTENFKSWDTWEEQNKAGYECHIEFFKDGNEVTLQTQNKGIYIQNTTRINDGSKEVYVALTGDQVALTDIRVR